MREELKRLEGRTYITGEVITKLHTDFLMKKLFHFFFFVFQATASSFWRATFLTPKHLCTISDDQHIYPTFGGSCMATNGSIAIVSVFLVLQKSCHSKILSKFIKYVKRDRIFQVTTKNMARCPNMENINREKYFFRPRNLNPS